MDDWSETELKTIGDAEELQISSRRADGTLQPYVTIWVVRAGDALYVRSGYGSTNPWYRRAKASRIGRISAGAIGRISAGAIEHDVAFDESESDSFTAIDAAYHTKYDRYGPKIVGDVVGEHTRSVTIRLQPR